MLIYMPVLMLIAFVIGTALGCWLEARVTRNHLSLTEMRLAALEHELMFKQERLEATECHLLSRDEEIRRSDKRPWKEES